MPRFDGTGPLGEGPMTGRSGGFCILKRSEEDPSHLEGLAGVQGEPVVKPGQFLRELEKKVLELPTQKAINLRPRFKEPRYMSRTVLWRSRYSPAIPVFGPYSAGLFNYSASYTVPYTGRGNPWFHREIGRAHV